MSPLTFMLTFVLGSGLIPLPLLQLLPIPFLWWTNAIPVGAQSPSNTVVDVGYTKYLGNQTRPSVMNYLGIRYASPPVADMRFRAAAPLNESSFNSSEVIDARSYPEFCIQGPRAPGDAGGAGSEDCLKLNIYAPVGAKPGDNLPVLVYIHGGAFMFNHAGVWPFDSWIEQSPTFIVVSVNYRLAAFGFLNSPAFLDSIYGDFHPGFRDQIEALRWTQKNIQAFGGNKDMVTINGQSAGGTTMEMLLVANLEETLFHQVIAQSVYRASSPTPEQSSALFDAFSTSAGCGNRAVSDTMSCLRNASVDTLSQAQNAVSYSTQSNLVYMAYRIAIDGKLISDFPTKLLSEGKHVNLPIIVGATTNETLTSLFPGGPDATSYLTNYFFNYTKTDADSLLGKYLPNDFASEDLRVQTVTGDAELRCARTVIGEALSQSNKVWTYRFNQPNPLDNSTGTFHAAENYLMFDGSNAGENGTVKFHPLTPQEQAFANESIAYWISFIRSGDPNTYKLPQSPTWEQFSTSSPSRIVLQGPQAGDTSSSGSFLEVVPEKESDRCRVHIQQNAAEEN